MPSAICFRPLSLADHQRLENLCLACSDFFACIEGQPGGRETAAELLGPLAPDVSSGEKSLVGVEIDGELVGVVELLAGFPGPQEWYIGLLLLRPDRRGAGAGTAIWQHLRQRMTQEGATSVRLIVQHQNPRARRFWERQGFAVEREMVAKAGKLDSPVWLLHRSLQAEDAHAVAAQQAAPCR
ncbi:GNAT family N-acetyltransferase [Cyanobium gracile]|uniref:Acetyltransferase n=1 Tax=Cyanobium gracile (strain ATCC 27147 / PCC 6307) TaxID=292564 RepID=K9P8N5_CYAGP|nr:GNAT family N-acetyltransferase [Cyanobium gracile]AFY29470.1 acetyltransferase [Cyanobium gracile PCC 6307]